MLNNLPLFYCLVVFYTLKPSFIIHLQCVFSMSTFIVIISFKTVSFNFLPLVFPRKRNNVHEHISFDIKYVIVESSHIVDDCCSTEDIYLY